MNTISVVIFLIGLSVCNGLLFNRTCDSRARVPVIGNFSVAPVSSSSVFIIEMQSYKVDHSIVALVFRKMV